MKNKISTYIDAISRSSLFAAGYVSLTDISSAPMFSSVFNNNSLPGFFNAVFKVLLSVGAILAVLRISYAGWKYMGTDLWTSKNDAKEIIKDAVLGLMLLLGMYIILYQINPDILELNALRNIK